MIASLSVLVALIALRYVANWNVMNSVFKTDVPLDLWIYMRGGERVTDGVNLYEGAIFKDLPFTYPPFSGLIFAWVSALDDHTVTAIWHTTTVVCAAAVIWFSVRRLNINVKRPSFVLIIPLLTVFFLLGTEPLHATLFWGQINVVLMLLVCLDFLPLKYRLPGIGVGLAAGIKLTPAFFGILFLIQRRWWAALGSFLTFLVTVLLGFVFVPDAKVFWTDAIFNSSRVGDHLNPGAQSLKSVLVRNFGVESGAVWLVVVLLVIALVAVAAYFAVERDCLPVAVGVTGFGACLVSPFTWYHHWVWIVPVAVSVFVAVNQAAARFTRENAARWQVAGLLSVGALVLVCAPFVAENVPSNLLWEDQPGVGLSWMYVPAAVLFLVGYVAYMLLERRERR
ncbi:glycosyltransferase 87 family protein [Corynebacterium urinipleomorphum]|uniref:glycosyltransferase 87 family protein n=1 Tax=Corynebacterium urinipleomorphum TaxID=1852380 RepID=UPI0013903351|nr:glycosyltransferase 87 family protein [Corynebacterium urinipleomorphum]